MPDHLFTREERLTVIADLLDKAAESDGFQQQSQLVRVADVPDDPGAFELGFKDLDGEHVADYLLGFTAPPEWTALGMITGGWAAPNDGGPASGHPDAVRIRMVVLANRHGDIVSRLRMADGRSLDTPADGYVVDVLRRCLGLPTAPPTDSTMQLLLALWLNKIAAAADEARRSRVRRLTWNQVARLHPAMQLLASDGTRPRAAELIPAARAFSRVLTWRQVREATAERAWLAAVVPQHLARWMDEGMLSRWLLTELAPTDALVREVVRFLRADVATRLEDAITQLADDSSAAA